MTWIDKDFKHFLEWQRHQHPAECWDEGDWICCRPRHHHHRHDCCIDDRELEEIIRLLRQINVGVQRIERILERCCRCQ